MNDATQFFNAVTGYEIERSLRFNSSDSAYLGPRTPASAGNRRTFTFSCWVKRAGLGGDQQLIYAAPSSTDTSHIRFDNDNTLHVFEYTTGFTWQVKTAQVFRDTSSWYHILVAVDTTQATASNRVKIYVNGAEVTAFSASSYPTQNTDTEFNNTVAHAIGRNNAGANNYLSAYLADLHWIDGQALTPSSFGEFDTNGVWQPIEYTGTYGTNGFQLKFADNSAATATTLGKDTSGNGNNWTPNNLSVTAGAGNDSLVDTPTSYGTDTEVRGNYATLNPLTVASPLALSNGNLEVSDNNTSAPVALGTIAVNAGKWYWEVTIGSTYCYIGAAKVTSRSSVSFLGSIAGQFMYNNSNAASSYINGATYNYSTGSASTTNDVIGVALDFDSNQITFYKNGVSMGVFGSNILGTDLWAPAYKTNAASSAIFNFGQRPFAYTAPSGFKALCTQNLPTPTIADGSTVMDVALWTGNGSARSITGLGFNPDLVWIKGRSGATDHALYDSVRGVEKRLESNNTDAEATSDGGVTAFNSDGFSLGTLAQVNTNTATYAGWTWDAGSSTVTNTAGTITSQVRANASAGFSIVSYTGTGVAGTIGHGLNVAPLVVLTKRRDSADDWYYFTTVIDGSYDYLFLNTTAAKANSASAVPTSSVINVSTSTSLNANGGTYVSYCFAPVAGYSAFGSYTGNGSADGPFVYTGFRPRWLLIKRTDVAGSNWVLHDTARDSYNAATKQLLPSTSDAETDTSLTSRDILSNGFKLRGNNTAVNGSGATYIYAAFAESPFALARAR